MKLRKGFVSNSSSSSFIVLLPENFIEIIDFDNITEGYDEFLTDKFKELLNKFISEGGIWSDSIYNDYDEYGYELHDVLHEVIQPYIVETFDAGPDAGQIKILDREKIKKLL